MQIHANPSPPEPFEARPPRPRSELRPRPPRRRIWGKNAGKGAGKAPEPPGKGREKTPGKLRERRRHRPGPAPAAFGAKNGDFGAEKGEFSQREEANPPRGGGGEREGKGKGIFVGSGARKPRELRVSARLGGKRAGKFGIRLVFPGKIPETPLSRSFSGEESQKTSLLGFDFVGKAPKVSFLGWLLQGKSPKVCFSPCFYRKNPQNFSFPA